MTLVVAMLGFFVVTFDAVVVNVALPAIRADYDAGISGLQWVVDGYTLMFAALLLWSGALSDRIGARRCFTTGLALFVAASIACGLAPDLGWLIAARFVQGSAAALMMPSSMALIGQSFPDPTRRSRAIAIWAMGGALASSSGPVVGGLLTTVWWRFIFFINVPVGAAAMALLSRVPASPRRRVPFDWIGQVSAVTTMAVLTFGVIEGGAVGFGAPHVVGSLTLAVVSAAAFVATESRVAHPMVPLSLFRSRNVSTAVGVGFAFVVGYYGLPFVMSLYLQQVRGLSPFGAGLVFVPMMIVGAVLTPFSARLAERAGTGTVVTGGLAAMTVGLLVLAAVTSAAPVQALAALMVLVGVAGPLVIPPVTAVLLNSVADHHAGTASGVFHTSRQIGVALAIAVFGGLLAQGYFESGLRLSLLVAAAVAFATALAARRLRPPADIASAVEAA